jgi:hypothetical protein
VVVRSGEEVDEAELSEELLEGCDSTPVDKSRAVDGTARLMRVVGSALAAF